MVDENGDLHNILLAKASEIAQNRLNQISAVKMNLQRSIDKIYKNMPVSDSMS